MTNRTTLSSLDSTSCKRGGARACFPIPYSGTGCECWGAGAGANPAKIFLENGLEGANNILCWCHQLHEDAVNLGGGVGGAGDLAADYQIVCAVANRLGGGGDALLIARVHAGRPHSGRHDDGV